MRAKTDKNKTNFLSPFLPLFHLLLFLLFRLLVKRHQGSSARASLCWWETAPASTCPSFDSKYGDAASACIAPAPLTQLETGRDSPEIDFSRGTFRQTERRMYGSSFLPEKLQKIKLKINIYSLTESKLWWWEKEWGYQWNIFHFLIR